MWLYPEKGAGVFVGFWAAVSGVPNTFQNLSVSSPAADATVHPSGLCMMDEDDNYNDRHYDDDYDCVEVMTNIDINVMKMKR